MRVHWGRALWTSAVLQTRAICNKRCCCCVTAHIFQNFGGVLHMKVAHLRAQVRGELYIKRDLEYVKRGL